MMERHWRSTRWLCFQVMTSMWTLAWSLTCTGITSPSPTDVNDKKVSTNSSVTPASNCTDVMFVSLFPPWRGSVSIEKGTGVSVGTELTFWCHEGFQLVGSEKISCILHGSTPQWSNYLPVCEAVMKPNDHGFHVAILVSVMSCIVILVMSLSFIICYMRDRNKRRESITRRDYGLGRSSEASFKIYQLSRHIESCLACNSHVHMIRLDGYENHGFHRSQESLVNDPLPGLYHTESPLYPLQSVHPDSSQVTNQLQKTCIPPFFHLLTDRQPTCSACASRLPHARHHITAPAAVLTSSYGPHRSTVPVLNCSD